MANFVQYKGDFFALATAFCWALSIIFLKMAGPIKLRSFQVNIIRNNLSLVLLFALALIMGEPLLPQLTVEIWLLIAASGFFGITLGDVLLFSSIKRTGAGVQALLDCVYSPLTILFAFFLFSEPLSAQQILGALLVLLSILIPLRGVDTEHTSLPGILFGLAAHISVIFGVLVIANKLEGVSIVTLTAYRIIFGQIALLIYSRPSFPDLKLYFWPFKIEKFKPLFLSTLLGGVLATLFWFLGFKYTLIGKAAIYNQTSSVFIFLLAWLFLKEKMTYKNWLALLLALSGALMVALS